ncbi:MAG TPA: efflux RND transporter permease subunit, partial [Candidatus Binatia bacterium]|nr:efflux RND transporter permease subunit [Candidatus Binatia bacterium]
LSLMLLPRAPTRARSPVARTLEERYRRLLPRIAGRPSLAIVIIVAAVGVSGLSIPWLGEEFLPSFRETDFLMHWIEKPGVSLDAVRRSTERVSAELRAIPGVRNFGAHIGRAEAAEEVVGTNFGELWISIEPTAPYEATVQRIQAVVDGYPGLYRDVLTYLEERIKEVLTGDHASIVVRIAGPDMDVLLARAQEAAGVMAGVPGVTGLQIEPHMLVPRVTIRLRPEAAEAFGLTAGQVRRAVTTLVQGVTVGEVYEHQRAYAVTVRGTPDVRGDVWAIGEIPIDGPDGAQVPLRDVAEIAIEPAPSDIKREGGERRLDVTCDAAGRDLGSVARDVEQAVRTLSFPVGYHPEFLGEYTARQESRQRLLFLGGMALLGIVVLLHVEFQSWRLTWLVLLTLPFALIGGVVGAFLGGGVLSLGSLVGFVTVLGVAARNGIMLLSHYQHLEQVEGEAFGPELIVRGATERLAPILMTASCAGLGLLPLVLAGNAPGHEIEFPMAVVILGGLTTSTMLNLLLMPALYGRFARPRRVTEPTTAYRAPQESRPRRRASP